MGGKSRKSGGVSKRLIDALKNKTGEGGCSPKKETSDDWGLLTEDVDYNTRSTEKSRGRT